MKIIEKGFSSNQLSKLDMTTIIAGGCIIHVTGCGAQVCGIDSCSINFCGANACGINAGFKACGAFVCPVAELPTVES